MKFILILFAIFIIEYEGYTWDPCSYDGKSGIGVCLAIACPWDGCRIPREVTICTDEDCVKAKLKQRGLQHLSGVYGVDLETKFIRKYDVVPSYDIR